MEVVGGVSLRPSPAPARIRTTLSSVDVGGRLALRAAGAPRGQLPARRALVVEARGRSWSERQMQQQRRMPQLPKIEDDGNPRFVIFIRTANVYFWYPLNIITGGTTAKIMLAAKDNFLGKYIYKDTLARNLAAVIYKDEDEIIDTAKEQYRVLKTENEFRYGYKVVEKGNIRSALTTSNVIETLAELSVKLVETKKCDRHEVVYKLLKLVLVLPVATASVERVFSVMNYVKNKLRNKFGDQYLNGCLVTFIERVFFLQVKDKDIINRFQAMKDRRFKGTL